MRRSNTPRSWAAASPAALLLAGCVVAAAGAGAGAASTLPSAGSNQSFPRQSSARRRHDRGIWSAQGPPNEIAGRAGHDGEQREIEARPATAR